MKTQAHRSFHLPESKLHFNSPREFKTEDISIDIALDLAEKAISGTCTITISPISGPLRSFSFDAVELDVSSVLVDGKRADFHNDGYRLTVKPGAELSQRATVEVEYRTTPREGIYFTGPEPAFPNKEVQAWTHSEAEFARYWFPCHDHPDEKCSSELIIEVPKGFIVVSNGILVSKKEAGSKTVFHWKEELPHPTYLTSFVVGAFGEMEQEAGRVKALYYFPESKRKDVLRYFGETPAMIRAFEELTGVQYPYAKYAQTTVEDFIYGGMENFNATTLSMSYYPDESSEEDFQTSYGSPQTNAVNLVAHELAHQWFGDLVTCSHWAHAWLNEGMATYFQGLYLEKSRGVDAMRWDLRARANSYFEEDETLYRRPIVDNDYVYPDDVFDLTLYEKGEAMLHELRFLMGDRDFFRGITEYLKAFSFSNADTHDFRKSMEKASGLSLEEFFLQSFFKPGYPEFEVDYSWDDSNRLATLKVKQVQKLDGGTPIFRLPCDLVFYSAGVRKSFRVMLGAAEESFSFSLSDRPSIVEFDPQGWLLKKQKFDKDHDLLQNQLEGSVDASSRAEAAKALGKSRNRRGIPALRKAALKEQFWDVRACSLKALGEIGGEEALAAILDVGLPEERRVRRAVAEALGSFKEEKAREVLMELLQKDPSPYVRCEAALALAKSWPEGAFPHLKEAMKAHSPNETLAEACLEAMGKVKHEDAASTVKESLAYGRPTRIRIGAMKAIRERGYVLDSEAPVLREMMLNDKEFRVRLYLIEDVVRRLGDKRFTDVVKEASRTDKDPRVRRRALETYYDLSAAAEVSSAVSRLRAEVDQLKEENRRLAAA